MPNNLRRHRSWLLVATLACTGAGVAVVADTPPPATITFLHVNDVYEIAGVDGGRAGGLARVATLVDRLKRLGPTIVTHGGDYLSPSPIGAARLEGQAVAGRHMVDVLNAMGLEWAVLGNHEFDVGEPAFRQRLVESRFRIVATNVSDASGTLFPGTVRSSVATVRSNGRVLRIGFIGLTTDFSQRPWIQYADPVASARRQIDAFRGQTDAIVALTHLLIPEDQALVEALPEIDLVLGGHEHENWILRRGAHFTPIVKADGNARTAAIVTVTFGRAGARPSVSARHQIIDTTVPEKPSMASLVRKWTTLALDAYRRDGFNPDRMIGRLPSAIDGRESAVRNRSGMVSDLVLAALERETTPVDVVVLNGGSIRIDDVLPAGPVSEYDVLRILPFGGKVVSASLGGGVLGQLLDAGVANRGIGGYLHVLGAERAEGGWRVKGLPLDANARYRVAMPEFLLTGGESRMNFLTRDNAGVSDVREHRDIRQALIRELETR